MLKILLDYFFPITSINPTPAASTAFLKQACVVVKPKDGGVTTGVISLCTTMGQVAALTNNTEAQQLFNAGLSRVFILPVDDLNLAEALEGHESDFYTLLISSDFNKDDVIASKASLTVNGDLILRALQTGYEGNDISIELLDTGAAGSEAVTVTDKKISVSMEAGVSTATQIKTAIDASDDAMELIEQVEIVSGQGSEAQAALAEDFLEGGDGLTLGQYKGVVGVSSDDDSFLAAQAIIENRAAFHTNSTNKAKNMFFAFGKLLANPLNWLNQQYIQMPFADDVTTRGQADNLFDNKVSFVISDAEFGNRLSLFAAGGKAIASPYIKRNLELDLQSRALQYVSANMPGYTEVEASLIESELQKVMESYVNRQWIESGEVQIRLEQQNFVASAYMNYAELGAIWRFMGEIRENI